MFHVKHIFNFREFEKFGGWATSGEWRVFHVEHFFVYCLIVRYVYSMATLCVM